MKLFKSLLKSMRPKQWVKNIFLFAALVFDRQLTNQNSLLITLLGFGIFCLLSSSVYLINDVKDIESDRNHPKKRFRPIAAGELSAKTALAAAFVLILLTIPTAFLINVHFGWITLIYFLINFAYSNWLKHIVILDVFAIAAGFVLRVAAGVSLIVVQRFSPWLFVCTTLLALFFGLGKRRGEIIMMAGNPSASRKVLDGYSIAFLDQLLGIVSSATIMAYSLYTFSAPNLPETNIMMLTIPFVLYGIFRYLYLVQVKGEGGAPDELVLTDRPLQVDFILWGLAILVIFYFG